MVLPVPPFVSRGDLPTKLPTRGDKLEGFQHLPDGKYNPYKDFRLPLAFAFRLGSVRDWVLPLGEPRVQIGAAGN